MSCKASRGVFENCLKSCKKTALKRPCLEMVVLKIAFKLRFCGIDGESIAS